MSNELADNRPIGVFKPRRPVKTRQNKDCIHYRIMEYIDINDYLKKRNYCEVDKENPKRTCGWLRKNDMCARKLRRYDKERRPINITK